jgi:hypothetical protein
LCSDDYITVTAIGDPNTGVQGLGDLIQGLGVPGDDALATLRFQDRIEPTPGPLSFIALLFAGGIGAVVDDFAEEATAGEINVLNDGLKHVVAGHGLAVAGKSTFNAGENLVTLIKAAESVEPTLQSNGNLQFIVDAGRAIGTDRNTGLPTTIYTVITDTARNLVTAFPGLPIGQP